MNYSMVSLDCFLLLHYDAKKTTLTPGDTKQKNGKTYVFTETRRWALAKTPNKSKEYTKAEREARYTKGLTPEALLEFQKLKKAMSGEDLVPTVKTNTPKKKQPTSSTQAKRGSGTHDDIPPLKTPVVGKTYYAAKKMADGSIKAIVTTKDMSGISEKEISMDDLKKVIKTKFGGDFRAAALKGVSIQDPSVVKRSIQDQIDAMAENAGTSKTQAKASRDSLRAFSNGSDLEIRNLQRGLSTGKDDKPITPKRRKELENHIANIERYVNNAPPYRGTVYRGMSFNSDSDRKSFLDKISGGYQLEAMSSFSSAKDIAASFAKGDGGTSKGSFGVLFSVKNKSGVSIQNISDFPDEAEVLAMKGAKYKIKGTPKKSGKMIVIELEEE